MTRPITTFAMLLLIAFQTNAQTSATSQTTQPYGAVSVEDLEMKQCDFQKDANAEVLFKKGDLYFDISPRTVSIIEEVHKRIKIFNDNGKNTADITIPYLAFFGNESLEYITGLQAETINLVDGKPQITKLDKKLIYTKRIDKDRSEITFTMPDVRPGCIIEYKYKWTANDFRDFPDWYFQEKIPVRYNELNTAVPDIFYYRAMSHVDQAYVKDTRSQDGRSLGDGQDSYPYIVANEGRALANVHSLPEEPYMSSFHDNVQAIRFQLISIRPIGGFSQTGVDSWAKVGGELIDEDDFGGQLKKKLSGEEVIIAKANAIKNEDEKIAYIFNEVKNAMKWDGEDDWEVYDGTPHAWDTKTGNSAEVNLILYHLLKQSGVDAYPMVVSTREHGKVDPFYTSVTQFNRAVVYVQVDTAKTYVLDATGKYNLYNEIPDELLNSTGLYIDKQKKIYDIVKLKKEIPVRETVLINAEIQASGKLAGTAQISNTSYNRISAVSEYKTDGEKKYIDNLRGDDNGLKINSLKMDNMESDTLPLVQNIDFNLDLAGSDGTYIYLSPNLFAPFKTNPFLSEERLSDVDFGYPRTYSINGVYKIPAGYKTDALPKNVNMVMPDKSFAFKRMVMEQEGSIIVRYVINFSVAEYSKDYYPNLHEFFKKMNEMLAEQIVLKKS